MYKHFYGKIMTLVVTAPITSRKSKRVVKEYITFILDLVEFVIM
jgi:hypothetical protein